MYGTYTLHTDTTNALLNNGPARKTPVTSPRQGNTVWKQTKARPNGPALAKTTLVLHHPLYGYCTEYIALVPNDPVMIQSVFSLTPFKVRKHATTINFEKMIQLIQSRASITGSA